MLIENYKGIEIHHDAKKDEFFTSVIIRKDADDPKKNEYIGGARLQRVRHDIDKFLNTAVKKPVLKKAWYKGKYDSDSFQLVTIVMYSLISNTVMIMKKDSTKTESVEMPKNDWRSSEKLFLSCKENDAIVAGIIKRDAEIEKIKKETSCSYGKLLPLKLEHFI